MCVCVCVCLVCIKRANLDIWKVALEAGTALPIARPLWLCAAIINQVKMALTVGVHILIENTVHITIRYSVPAVHKIVHWHRPGKNNVAKSCSRQSLQAGN